MTKSILIDQVSYNLLYAGNNNDCRVTMYHLNTDLNEAVESSVIMKVLVTPVAQLELKFISAHYRLKLNEQRKKM